jgi:two-component system cell cycle response regulator DivK
MKILVCEDDPKILSIIRSYFDEVGINYQLLKTIDGTLDKVKSYLPDLILCDLLMHGEYAFSLISQLKNDPETEHIPIVAITALVDKRNQEKAIKAGVEEILEKPFKISALSEVINKYSI